MAQLIQFSEVAFPADRPLVYVRTEGWARGFFVRSTPAREGRVYPRDEEIIEYEAQQRLQLDPHSRKGQA